MAGTARQQAGERPDVDDLRRFAALVVDLLVRPRREEAGERVDDRQRAAARHAARHRHHVLLGDAALDEALGVLPRERHQAAVLDEIGVEHEQLRVPSPPARRARARRRPPGCRSAAARAAGCACASRSRRSEAELAADQRPPPRAARQAPPCTRLRSARRSESGRASPGFMRRAFHEADAPSLDRVGDDHLRPIGDRVERAERPLERRDVMAVAPGSRASRTRGTSPRDRRGG